MKSVGRLQRTSPLPIGEYWIDVIGPTAQEAFAVWRFENQSTIQILTTESFEADEGFPARDWVKFEVKSPTPWQASKIGYPNIIGDDEVIMSSEDTAHNLPTEAFNPFDSDNPLGKTAIAAGVIAVSAIVLAIVVRR